MKPLLLTSLTMVAFAANSVINRFSLAEGEIDPAGFALIRVLAGAIVLIFLVAVTNRPKTAQPKINFVSVLALAAYILGFSFAYVTLDAGIGALILFGGVQITMFAGALFAGEHIPLQRWLGSALAISGLVWLLAPSEVAPTLLGAILMATAAIGWGVYSLIGQKATDPLLETQRNFLYAIPLVALAWVLWPDQIPITRRGILLAALSGAVTSGLGYALWYYVLPRLNTITASVAQLTVPVIAMAGGVLFLSEPVSARFIVSALLIMSGIIIAVKR